MENYNLAEDLTVFGVQVKSFPNGVGEAFGQLEKTFGTDRAYYGLSWFNENEEIIYYAGAQGISKGEANTTDYEIFTIPKGNYRTETITNWMSKTDSIKDVFHRLMGDNRPSKTMPCIEWYKSDDEMLCMVKD